MERREFLAAAAGSLATAATTGLFSTVAFASENEIEHKLIVADKRILSKMGVVAKTAAECVAAAQACIQHCNEQLIAGNGKEFANCALASHQMVPVCEMIGTLAAYKAVAISSFLEGCIQVCDTCRLACKEHEMHFSHGMHTECKRCMEACAACLKACQELKAAIG